MSLSASAGTHIVKYTLDDDRGAYTSDGLRFPLPVFHILLTEY